MKTYSNSINIFMKSFKEFIAEKKKDPCWKKYKMVGMKKKGNKQVPNCVPK